MEDNKLDARLTRHAFQQVADWPAVLTIAEDGGQAMKLLSGDAPEHGLPDLVILDLNLPKYDGVQVLQFIRTRPALDNSLVFIFSSSPVELVEERLQVANVKADAIFEKPSMVGTFHSVVDSMGETYRRTKQERQSVAVA